MQFVTENAGNEFFGWLGGDQVREDDHEERCEASAEVGTVDICWLPMEYGIVNVHGRKSRCQLFASVCLSACVHCCRARKNTKNV